jgi:hypothetical protein
VREADTCAAGWSSSVSPAQGKVRALRWRRSCGGDPAALQRRGRGRAFAQVTVSVGVSVYGGDVRRLFNDADRAL